MEVRHLGHTDFEVCEDSVLHWETLFLAIQSVNQNIRINNVDESLSHKIKALESAGLKNTVNQFEMVLDI